MPADDISGEIAERIAALAETRLTKSPHLAGQRINCRFCEGILTLWGRVPSHSLRHAAQAVVERIHGVQRVDNRIEVLPLPPSIANDYPKGEPKPHSNHVT